MPGPRSFGRRLGGSHDHSGSSRGGDELAPDLFRTPPLSVSSDTTVTDKSVVLVDSSSNAVTVTLGSNLLKAGQVVRVIDENGSASTNTITVDTEGGETIEPGSTTSKTVTTDYAEISFIPNSGEGQWRATNRNVERETIQADLSRTAHDVSGRELDLREYGADATGSDPCDQELDDAVADANPDDSIVFRDGDFSLEADDHAYAKPLALLFDDAKLLDGRSAASVTGRPLIKFVGTTDDGSTTLSSSADRGTGALSVGDASIVEAGDTVFVRDQEGTEIRTEFFTVLSTSAGQITLAGKTRHDFRANASVQSVDLIEEPRVVGLRAGPTVDDAAGLISFEGCRKPIVRDLYHEGISRYSVRMLQCWRPTIVDATARESYNYGGGEGEPFSIAECTDPTLRSPTAHDVRRGVDVLSGSCGAYIEDPDLRGVTHRGVAMHGHDVTDVTVVGGTVQMQSGEGGSCLDCAPYSAGMRAIGTELHPDRTAIGPGGPMTVMGADIHVPADHGGAGSAVIEAKYPDISIGGGTEIHISDLADNLHAIRIDDSEGAVSNVDIEAEIEVESVSRSSGDALVYATHTGNGGVSDIDLDLEIDAGGLDDSPAVSVDGSAGVIEDVDITGGAINTGRAIDLRGDAGVRDVSVEGMRIRGTGRGVFVNEFDNLATACERIWVKNNDIDMGGNEVEIGNGNADTVWVVDNAAASVVVDSGATNVEQRGNQ